MIKNLNENWTLTGTDECGKEIALSTKVPCCVHTDLRKENLICDYFWRDNSNKVTWIENKEWVYESIFNLESAGESALLCFDGLDTYATIYLNGKEIGHTDNMFIPYEFDVKDVLMAGENKIKLVFQSPIEAIKNFPERDGAFTSERINTRRVQCSYGWDWVARFVTCGIWKDVYLKINETFRTDNLYIYTKTLKEDYAEIGIEIDFESPIASEIELIAYDGENNPVSSKKQYCNEKKAYSSLFINNPKLWKPYTMGEPSLYRLELYVGGKIANTQTFGIRTIEILQRPDEVGSDTYNLCLALKETKSGKEYDKNKTFSSFEVLINGKPTFCKGANWVPCEPFPSDESDEKITRLLELAKECGINMLRVWGGGIFEHKHFYDECDRLGIMVTQDFLMACGLYPEKEEWFIEQVKKEARFAALYLRNHPCLLWWSGDNENAVLGCDTDKDYHGRRVFYEAISPMLKKYDATRYAFASSPYNGELYASKTKGTTHNSQFLGVFFDYIVKGEFDDYKDVYKNFLARFVVEEPTMGAVCDATLKSIMTEEELYSDSLDMWIEHTKTNPFLPKELFDYSVLFADGVLGKSENTAERNFKLKYLQYEWVRISMELYLRNQAFCHGVLYWMWNDCWPAASGWAMVDYYLNKKASFYSLKRFAKGLVCGIDNVGEVINLHTMNTSCGPVSYKISLKKINLKEGSSELLFEGEGTSKANDSEIVFSFEDKEKSGDYVYVAELNSDLGSDRAFYMFGTLKLKKCEIDTEIASNSVIVSSKAYVHAVEIEGVDGVSDNYFSLLPNEKREIKCLNPKEAKIVAYTF